MMLKKGMDFKKALKEALIDELKTTYDLEADIDGVILNETRKEFEGDYTLVVFPYVKSIRKSPVEIGNIIGTALVEKLDFVESYNVVQGFINFKFTDAFWKDVLWEVKNTPGFGRGSAKRERILVEFSSPNTNKPLHLGHIRNILLGWSTSQILEYAGYDVFKTQIINDRGIAICKSMLAWQKYGEGATPETKNRKSDHFVGDFYVLFESKFKAEYESWQKSEVGQQYYKNHARDGESPDAFYKRYKNDYFNEHSELGAEASDMLILWEAKEEKTRQLWTMMNEWVYNGFEETYQNLGVSFDKLYYESDTYLLGKDAVEDGLKNGVFYKEEDGSVWIDLEDAGMDKKIVLRSNGTSVYMTQDIGTAQLRYSENKVDRMVYVVADEQDYHFKVLFEILKRMGEPYADGLHHLSYGMVDLPSGKMKSREGNVVDADDLMQEVINEARANAMERGELEELSLEEREAVYRNIGLAALKFFILKVTPQKRMTFDPKESVDMQGQTGPYIQNAYVRVMSVLRKYDASVGNDFSGYDGLNEFENDLLKEIVRFPEVIEQAAAEYDPSHLANYCYELAKMYHRFYHEVRILSAETEAAKQFRLVLSKQVAEILSTAMNLLGIQMPERM